MLPTGKRKSWLCPRQSHDFWFVLLMLKFPDFPYFPAFNVDALTISLHSSKMLSCRKSKSFGVRILRPAFSSMASHSRSKYLSSIGYTPSSSFSLSTVVLILS